MPTAPLHTSPLISSSHLPLTRRSRVVSLGSHWDAIKVEQPLEWRTVMAVTVERHLPRVDVPQGTLLYPLSSAPLTLRCRTSPLLIGPDLGFAIIDGSITPIFLIYAFSIGLAVKMFERVTGRVNHQTFGACRPVLLLKMARSTRSTLYVRLMQVVGPCSSLKVALMYIRDKLYTARVILMYSKAVHWSYSSSADKVQ